MNMRALLFPAVFLFLIASSWANEPEHSGARREGTRATDIITIYENRTRGPAPGIPSDAAAYRRGANGERNGKPVMVATDASMVTEDSSRLIRVRMSLRDDQDREIADIVAFFAPFSDRAFVVKTILQSRYLSLYKWEIPGVSLASVTTTDMTTNKKVQVADNLEITNEQLHLNSEGGYSKKIPAFLKGTERQYSDDDAVYESAFKRNFCSGMIIEEKAIKGSLQKDYHTFEYVLSGWPLPNSPDGGFMIPLSPQNYLCP